ncbi:hypothetical protein [Natronomonas gomsonensis]|uniref:hypothetical protein n=1 Tax=Natronomonas gomsonensis TaxID=1046043 RepID=UPI0015B81E35|nr:hypothetical protein [Natronomonas gomsonensis]
MTNDGSLNVSVLLETDSLRRHDFTALETMCRETDVTVDYLVINETKHEEATSSAEETTADGFPGLLSKFLSKVASRDASVLMGLEFRTAEFLGDKYIEELKTYYKRTNISEIVALEDVEKLIF